MYSSCGTFPFPWGNKRTPSPILALIFLKILPSLKATLKLAWIHLLSAETNLKLGTSGCVIYLLLHKINPKSSDLISNIDVLPLLISVGQIFGKGSED